MLRVTESEAPTVSWRAARCLALFGAAWSLVAGCDRSVSHGLDSTPHFSTLPSVDQTLQDGFTFPYSVVERSDDSALVSDRAHGEVWLADFSSGERTSFGRNGDGPGEFRYVSDLFRLSSDSVGVFSLMIPSALAVLAGDGTPVRNIRLSAYNTLRGSQADFDEYPELSRAGERGEVLGARSTIVSLGGGFSAQLDSVPIMRLRVETGSIDTVAFFEPGESYGWRSPLPDDRAFVLGKGPFAAQHDWTVLHTGTIVKLNAERFSLDFMRDGDVSRTVSVPVADSFAVSEDAWRAHVEAATQSARDTPMYRGGIGRRTPTGGSLLEAGPPEIRVPERPSFWPPVLGYIRMRVAENQIWVPVSGPQSPARQYWTVVDTLGSVLDRFEFPPNTRLISVTARYVYTARSDDDDLQWVSRHRNPLAR